MILKKYIDFTTQLLYTMKTKTGKDLKSTRTSRPYGMEAWPNWNTIFVEVPLTTFNPVKTVNDLTKEPLTKSQSKLMNIECTNSRSLQFKAIKKLRKWWDSM